MLREVPLETESLRAGWFLVEGELGRRGRNQRSSLCVHRRSAAEPVQEIPLPVLVDGRIRELVRLPRDVGRLVWRPPAIEGSEPPSISIRRVGWLERTCRMVVRVVRTYVRLSEHEREECGLFLRRALFDLHGMYRLCTGFLVRTKGQPYSEWRERYDVLDDHDRRLIA